MKYEEVFEALDVPTKALLCRMTQLQKLVYEAKAKPREQLEYVQLCIALFETIRRDESICARRGEPLIWTHGKSHCNCLFFEITRYGMDTAVSFLLEEEKAASLTMASVAGVIGVLHYIVNVAYPQWVDGDVVKKQEHYTEEDAMRLYKLMRAYGHHWWFTERGVNPESPKQLREAIETYAMASKLVNEFHPYLDVYSHKARKKIALYAKGPSSWCERVKPTLFSYCQQYFHLQGSSGIGARVACLDKLCKLGETQFEALYKSESALNLDVYHVTVPGDISAFLLKEFEVVDKLFIKGIDPTGGGDTFVVAFTLAK